MSTFLGFVVTICFMLFVLKIVIPFLVWLYENNCVARFIMQVLFVWMIIDIIKSILGGRK